MNKGALAVYKNRPALVVETGEKITIQTAGKAKQDGEILKVREKDIEILHPGPLRSLEALEQAPGTSSVPETGRAETDSLREAWELLEGGGPVSLEELAELAFGSWTPENAWAAWRSLGTWFEGSAAALLPKSAAEVKAAGEKKENKEREGREREAFLERLRNGNLDFPADGRFLQDAEALAWGQSEKSRTLKDLGRAETPEEAHRLLLETGFWDMWVNPHPRRFGLSLVSAPAFPLPGDIDLMKGRKDLTSLTALAIDSPWSSDPDDALSLETGPEGRILYVHVADPALLVTPGSSGDLEACGRGATAYLPETCARMLPEELLPLFALGLAERSPALTFAISLDPDGLIRAVEIFPSIVSVTRLSYEEADRLAGEGGDGTTGGLLRELFELARNNVERRRSRGAVFIDLPEVHITAEDRAVSIRRIAPYQSADAVRECMLLAGEAAALWAAERRLAFPYITQESGDLPSTPLPGLAGSAQLRRCMRPRAVSVKPGRHAGLGLDAYTQVTSPLRRYTDLLAHQQIRAFLSAGKGPAPLDEAEVLLRASAGDAASQAVTQAERASKAHWLAVYLSDKTGSVWDGVVLDRRANGLGVIIPELALETAVSSGGLQPNDPVRLTLSRVRLPEADTLWTI